MISKVSLLHSEPREQAELFTGSEAYKVFYLIFYLKMHPVELPWWCNGLDCTPNAEGMDLIASQGTKIPHATQWSWKKKIKKSFKNIF